MHDAVERLGTFDASDGAEEPALVASAVEFLLEGLHLAAAAEQGPRSRRRDVPAVSGRADPTTMAFLTPDPRAPRPQRSARRRRASPSLAGRRPLPRVGRLAGRPGPDADEIVDALADDLLERRRPGRGAPRTSWSAAVGAAIRHAATCAGSGTSSTGCATAGASCSGRASSRDPLADVRRELDEIVDLERAGVQRRLDETEPGFEPVPRPATSVGADAPPPTRSCSACSAAIAAKRLDSLDALPPDVGARIRGLQDYDFLDGDARERFEELVDRLRRQRARPDRRRACRTRSGR